jgi:hypothetical protein
MLFRRSVLILFAQEMPASMAFDLLDLADLHTTVSSIHNLNHLKKANQSKGWDAKAPV